MSTNNAIERGNAALDRLVAANDGGASQLNHGWSKPMPLPQELPPVEPFDEQLLPIGLRHWAIDAAERMQCPPDFLAVGVLTSISSLIARRHVVQPKQFDDWQVVPNLWGMIVGRPGAMKSPALKQAMAPLADLEKSAIIQHQEDLKTWQLDVKMAELQEANSIKRAKTLVGTDPAAARALLAEAEPPSAPVARRYVVTDTTVEKLGEILAANPGGVLVYRDELYGQLTSLDKPGQEGARAFYLQAYDGNQGYTFDRITRASVHLDRVCISMLGGTQPSRVQEYVRAAVTGGGSDDGLLQRFGLAVWPDPSPTFKLVDRVPNRQGELALHALFERLSKDAVSQNEVPIVWRFAPDAQLRFNHWMTDFETDLRENYRHPAIESHLTKYRKLVPALALQFALIDDQRIEGVINDTRLILALAWAKYLKSHAERLYSAASRPEMTAAANLLNKVQAGKLGVDFTAREVLQKTWTGLNSLEVIRKAAGLLAEYDWLRKVNIDTGGRPSERYLVNPAAVKATV